MHEPWDENYQRGYEWWLMTEAKKVFDFLAVYSSTLAVIDVYD